MRNMHSILRNAGLATALAGALAMPAFAQNANNTNNVNNPANSNSMANTTAGVNGTNNNGDNGNHNGPTGSLVKTHGMWRSGSIDGATVYNDQGQNIGTIDNLLLNSSGKAEKAIISVGGFIGIGNRLVEVPFSHLTFKPSTGDNNGANNGNNNHQQDYSIVLSNASKQSLTKLPAFSYNNNNQ